MPWPIIDAPSGSAVEADDLTGAQRFQGGIGEAKRFAALDEAGQRRFTLFDAGIRPGAMRIKARLVNIHIEDRTNTSQGVTIQRVAGGERVAIGSVQKVATDLRGRSSFILAPGEYELFDVSKPANKAVLQVEP